MEGNQKLGRPTMLTCPDCDGALWEIPGDDILRFRCHVGHSYTAEAMMISQSEALEKSMWAAAAALQQRAKLCESLLEKARARNLTYTIGDLERQIREARMHSDVIRRMLLRGGEFSHNQGSKTPSELSDHDRPRDTEVVSRGLNSSKP